MSRSNSLTPMSDGDYEAIEAAVMETTRGRWFLAEYARRNRAADTMAVLEAIGRLERFVSGERAAHDVERIRYELVEMAEAIARTKTEIAALRPRDGVQSHFEEATEVLDRVVRTTERATSDILEAAERIQETAWTLREADAADPTLCDTLDRRATDIYTACSFQDITAQRTTKVVHVLRYLEGRINAMIDVWGQSSEAAPRAVSREASASLDHPGLSQDDIDIVISDEPLDESWSPDVDRTPSNVDDVVFIESSTDASPEADPAPRESASAVERASADRGAAFAAIDELDVAEKLRRFS